ncbi:MAG: SWIM zinc finger family protein [Kovacikia sp.]
MAKFSRTWWGQRWIESLESFTDSGRLSRGRSYASGGKILEFKITKGKIEATVRGSVNPYFGVYKEPRYKTVIEVKPIPPNGWEQAIAHLSAKASFVSKLLLGEIPTNVEDVFAKLGLHLLPFSRVDFKTSCSCPDYSNPCKHIAGLCYRVASELDSDPFLLFQLRGLSKEDLQAELRKSPLGEILSAELDQTNQPPVKAESYYTPPQKDDSKVAVDLKHFWSGAKRLPQAIDPPSQNALPAVLIKKQGDFPPFWNKDHSFIETMEGLYERVRTKNRDVM